MNTRRHPSSILAAWLAASALLFVTTAALPQASAPLAAPELPASGASAPASPAPVGPRLRSPIETGNRATVPGDLRPERPVTPQISIPFGKSPPPLAKGEPRGTKRGVPPVVAGGVDDAAARCESQVDDQVRATCRARLAREAKGKPAK